MRLGRGGSRDTTCAETCSGGVLREYTELRVRGSYYCSLLGRVGLLLKYTRVFVEGCFAESVGVGNWSV